MVRLLHCISLTPSIYLGLGLMIYFVLRQTFTKAYMHVKQVLEMVPDDGIYTLRTDNFTYN